MTLDEARKIAATCSTADGGCGYCVEQLCEALKTDFPEFHWTVERYNTIVVTERRAEERGGGFCSTLDG